MVEVNVPQLNILQRPAWTIATWQNNERDWTKYLKQREIYQKSLLDVSINWPPLGVDLAREEILHQPKQPVTLPGQLTYQGLCSLGHGGQEALLLLLNQPDLMMLESDWRDLLDLLALAARVESCLFCGLQGHQISGCLMKKKFDELFQRQGKHAAWGQAKGEGYYRELKALRPLLFVERQIKYEGHGGYYGHGGQHYQSHGYKQEP